MTAGGTTIGVAIDVGDSPGVVLTHALAWAHHLDARLHVVTVSDDPSADVALAELANQLPAERRGALARLPVPATDEAEAEGGPVAQALGQLKVDLLLVGTHARRGLERLLFGSVAQPIVRHSPLPVLVCPLHAEPARAPLAVACPVDPDELDWTAVRWVSDRLAASLHVVAAYPHETAVQQFAGEDLDNDVRHRLESGLASVGTPNVTLHGLPGVAGDPAEALAHVVDALGVDLVALPSHQRHGFDRWWHGSVAETLVREVSCAVLVFPMSGPA